MEDHDFITHLLEQLLAALDAGGGHAEPGDADRLFLVAGDLGPVDHRAHHGGRLPEDVFGQKVDALDVRDRVDEQDVLPLHVGHRVARGHRADDDLRDAQRQVLHRVARDGGAPRAAQRHHAVEVPLAAELLSDAQKPLHHDFGRFEPGEDVFHRRKRAARALGDLVLRELDREAARRALEADVDDAHLRAALLELRLEVEGLLPLGVEGGADDNLFTCVHPEVSAFPQYFRPFRRSVLPRGLRGPPAASGRGGTRRPAR